MTKKYSAGFTLVELLVVVAIIAILSIIGMVILTGVQKSARDAKRRADIDAIAKVFETKYNYLTGKYQRPSDADYVAGGEPNDPKGTLYDINLINSDTSFRACATLEGEPPTYCKVGAQGSAATTFPPCAKFNNFTTGQSQSCKGVFNPASSSIYIKCSEIPITPPHTLDCSVTGVCAWLPSGSSSITIPYYASANATSPSGNFSPTNQGCIITAIPVYLRD